VTLLASTFGICFVSALIPLVNAEAYIGGVGILSDRAGVWAVSAAAALGQTAGKVIWYYLGRSSLNWGWVRRRTESSRWQARFATWQRRTRGSPWLVSGLVFVSAVVGLPPLAILSVLAGQLALPLPFFVAACATGRLLRFAAVLGGIGFLVDSGIVG
jgi:membrane protein YqaA with SNARE-associated domain